MTGGFVVVLACDELTTWRVDW